MYKEGRKEGCGSERAVLTIMTTYFVGMQKSPKQIHISPFFCTGTAMISIKHWVSLHTRHFNRLTHDITIN
jgi:hypothetical protein